MSSTTMINSQTPTPTTSTSTPPHQNNTNDDDDDNDDDFRDIHALTPPQPSPLPAPPSRQRVFDASSRRSSNLSVGSDITNSSENFTTMSREFNALVVAGSSITHTDYHNGNQVGGNGYNGNGNDWNNNNNNNINLDRIGEDEGDIEETNPLAIVADINPLPSPGEDGNGNGNGNGNNSSLSYLMGSNSTINNNNSYSNSNSNSNNNNTGGGEIAVHRVKKEEVETKIASWQTAKIAKINNRFKREDAVISGWENEQVLKATSWMKKVEKNRRSASILQDIISLIVCKDWYAIVTYPLLLGNTFFTPCRLHRCLLVSISLFKTEACSMLS
ncbi:remorin 4.2 isoform X2 [Beta vulgaris subsp. vulgaris]|uniref:remorin 4.2 isoform X2 n=1 Tax=Beta vulgaris subsp. vulgaris TaxID=3555 RepID=UPI002548B7FF|nr:remorin 4.2 isoform X2 [Beta vulgaris subsp. vulgaris]